MNTIEKRRLLAERQEEVRKLAEEVGREEQGCQHKFGDSVSDPIVEPDMQFSHYDGAGSDPNPVYHRVGDKSTPRWKQTCEVCGKVQYTSKTRPTGSAPDFG